MKYLILFLAFFTFLLSMPACSREVEDVPTHGCNDYVAIPAEMFVADLVLTTSSGVLERSVIVLMYPSGGAGVYWGGVAGTARSEHVVVDYAIPTLEITLKGTAGANFGSFVQKEGARKVTYEFSNFRIYEEGEAKALMMQYPIVDLGQPMGGLEIQ